MSNTYKLIEVILANSESENFQDAKHEWAIKDYNLSENEQCICGKLHIKQCYTIINSNNNKKLYPVGSECIKKFERDDLLNSMKIFGNKNTIFKNSKGMHDGKTYGFICENHPSYIDFLENRSTTTKRCYLKLIEYYNTTKQ